jgi:hypothetical protein
MQRLVSFAREGEAAAQQYLPSSVQLIEALGGGWKVDQLPSERQVAARDLLSRVLALNQV